ncbi:serine hydroxymethyltransferase [Neoehrlichia mikurensis]|uniref:Serine hydroxymethyltransferase n=1 Tax=Neoehrlichia mikurensis TaxID=89586 RepID=A0A9Q9F479_9RICK|nr:serine hydroxymethyltransferase [Neoehrlichia mikurensis]QXK91721.1 serine hydroxymethyltransferase [Neoehrlichia mikurensis]QXK92933.1 serine hydroxymethyltransferase [Neoehrlichia mikurensis]QXK93411.1 serine hydroxymethyltransferase [Neoehrlichia mikurensis]UTO55638.1 serine hydroxymethyltransferase [Neoehrlichia mikurensis]UTO56559.1 serine hydroxymethyltransferase [Neoehrlichia mikurensis]
MDIVDSDLKNCDSEVFNCIIQELQRQKTSLQLIASENFVSKAVLQAQGSIFTNKYAEGYPGKRYYCGCQYADLVENLAISRLCELFGCKFANVQPHSGSQANQEVFMALLKPGDTVLGMSLGCGGHLTHGSAVSVSGKWFKSVQYDVDCDTGLIDMDKIEELAVASKPSLIIAGASSYPRRIDFKAFRAIADKVGAYFLADVSHYAGLIAAGVYPSPINDAHVVVSTTHKTLRGPRGGVIMTNYEDIHKKIQSSVFPGMQGGPLVHVIAAKAVAFGEALRPEFKLYGKQVIDNAKVLANTLQSNGFHVVTGGTDSHLMVLDLRSKNITGKDAVLSLERSGIVCNKNVVPFDTAKPSITSGLRLGSAAETSRGLGITDFETIGHLISKILNGLSEDLDNISVIESNVKSEVAKLCCRLKDFSFEA